MKTHLTATMQIDGKNISLVCRKLSDGKYVWYGNDGDGKYRNTKIPNSDTIDEAKHSLTVTYPTSRYNLKFN